MLYNLDNTIRTGNPVRVFDANGLEWTGVIECDTETGRILKYVEDEKGMPVEGARGSMLEGELVRETVFTSAPLLVIPKKGK